VETIVRTRDVPQNDSVGADPSTALGMTASGVIPSERSESRDLHPRAPRALQVVREPEPPPATMAAHRALEPAEPVEVECEGEVPRVVTWRGHRLTILRPIGPERLSGDWWDDGYRRDYWRCESLAGEFVVYLDRADDAWRLQGWVD